MSLFTRHHSLLFTTVFTPPICIPPTTSSDHPSHCSRSQRTSNSSDLHTSDDLLTAPTVFSSSSNGHEQIRKQTHKGIPANSNNKFARPYSQRNSGTDLNSSSTKMKLLFNSYSCGGGFRSARLWWGVFSDE
ncbi:hypothetical protein LIER_35838 [Lithospermum erythrorhizon]|uniref:Uncharacterized protein n=1 Tax=Lithospermum erythrorhizon TaxID=34254 RepID=A0AAV3P161_LITER